MVLAKSIDERLDALHLSEFWPTYENTGTPVRRGDRAIGTTFDYEGRDYQHEGMVVDVILTFTDVLQSVRVTIEEDNGDDWECETDDIELVMGRDS